MLQGRQCREKGKRFERTVRDIFGGIFDDTRRTGWQQAGDNTVPDVTAGPFHIECKVGKNPKPIKALEQAELNCPYGRWAISVCKQDRCRPVVAMRLEDFIDLVREWFDRAQ